MDLGCPLLRGTSDRRLRRCAATTVILKCIAIHLPWDSLTIIALFENQVKPVFTELYFRAHRVADDFFS